MGDFQVTAWKTSPGRCAMLNKFSIQFSALFFYNVDACWSLDQIPFCPLASVP